MKKKIKVAFVIGIAAKKYGGPPAVLASHCSALGSDADITVYAVSEPGDESEIHSLYPHAQVFPKGFPNRWRRGIGLRETLEQDAKYFDIIHGHMLWDHTIFAAAQAAKRVGVPFVITPHGSVMEKWRYRTWHKQLYRRAFLNRILSITDAMHALNPAEAKAIRAFGYSRHIAVIPNGLPKLDYNRPRDPEPILKSFPRLREKNVLVYMGRIWSGKGLDLLLNAWASLKPPIKAGWILALAGPDYRNYRKTLEKMAFDLNLSKSVIFCGEVYGPSKDALLACGKAFALPSHSEAFSVALLEAMSAGLPLLITDKCNFPEAAEAGVALEVHDDLNGIKQGLAKLLTLPSHQLKKMGAKGRALGEKYYSLDSVKSKLLGLYENLKKNPTKTFNKIYLLASRPAMHKDDQQYHL